AIAARAFAEIHQGESNRLPPAQWPSTITTSVENRDRAQTAMTLLFAGPARNDPDRYTAAMIASVASGLGGRFFDELRDKRSLCYTVNAFAADRRMAGMFGSFIAASPGQENAGRAGLLAGVHRFRREPAGEEEGWTRARH